MPNSSNKGKAEIKEWFKYQNDINIILDIGPGAATYPKLIGTKGYYWIGLEIFERYVERFKLKEYYDTLIIGDVTVEPLPFADCIIFGDVLEHLSEAWARKLVKLATQKYKHVVVSIPVEYEQGTVGGNPHEAHKSIWTAEQLDKLFPASFKTRILIDNIYIFIK